MNRLCLTCGIPTPGTYCPEHKRAKQRQRDASRPTPAERGYDWQWAELSKLVRAEEPFCHWCIAEGLPYPRRSEVADHVVPLSRGGTSDRSNLVGACLSHNRRRAVS